MVGAWSGRPVWQAWMPRRGPSLPRVPSAPRAPRRPSLSSMATRTGPILCRFPSTVRPSAAALPVPSFVKHTDPPPPSLSLSLSCSLIPALLSGCRYRGPATSWGLGRGCRVRGRSLSPPSPPLHLYLLRFASRPPITSTIRCINMYAGIRTVGGGIVFQRRREACWEKKKGCRETGLKLRKIFSKPPVPTRPTP